LANHKQELPTYGGHISCMIGTKYRHLEQDLPYYHSYKVTIRCAS